MSNMLCVVCQNPAVVWCHNDEAALCLACDETVHSAGPLAWKHKRTLLSSSAPHPPRAVDDVSKQATFNEDVIEQGAPAMPLAPVAHVSANERESAKQPSLHIADIPFMNDIEKGATMSFDMNKLIEDFKAGDSFDVNLLAERGLGTGSLDLLSLPLPSFDAMTGTLPDVCAQAEGPALAPVADAAALQEPTTAAQDKPPTDPQPDQNMDTPAHALDSGAAGNSADSASSLVTLRDRPQPPAEVPPSTTPADPYTPPAPAPAADAPAAAMPIPAAPAMQNAMPILLAAFPAIDPCMAYIPATLQPKSEDDRAAAREALHARRERFRQKKSLQAQKRATAVRYISRKAYADTRPRINGRFIRKDSSTAQ